MDDIENGYFMGERIGSMGRDQLLDAFCALTKELEMERYSHRKTLDLLKMAQRNKQDRDRRMGLRGRIYDWLLPYLS